jgi:hypothetical protein
MLYSTRLTQVKKKMQFDTNYFSRPSFLSGIFGNRLPPGEKMKGEPPGL